MADPELFYTTALAALRKAEADYAAAESKLIEARRRVAVAGVGTKYYKMLHRQHVDQN